MRLFGPPGRGDRLARRLAVPLALTLVFLIIVFWVVYTPVEIIGHSMYPTLRDGDRVLVTRAYGPPRAGDAVHIETAMLEGAQGGQIVKRVVGVPGDSVRIVGGRAIVNGSPEESRAPLVTGADDVELPAVRVPAGHVYVLGDNRSSSFDSRYYGPVPLEAVQGRVVFVYAPITALGLVD